MLEGSFDELIIREYEAEPASEYSIDNIEEYAGPTFKDVQTVVDFNNNQLKAYIANTAWCDITADPNVGVVGDKFFVFFRKRIIDDICNINSNDFSKYQSLASIQSGNMTRCIGVDAEWFDYKNEGEITRFILSWQFAYIDDDYVCEMIFIPKTAKHRLKLTDALAVIYTWIDPDNIEKAVKVADVRTYRATVFDKNMTPHVWEFAEKNKAIAASGGKSLVTHYDSVPKEDFVSICIITHYGVGDIFSFEKLEIDEAIKGISSIQKGMVSLRPIKKLNAYLPLRQWHSKRFYAFSLNVRDTACHTPAKHKGLDALGDVIGLAKLDVESAYENCKERMHELLMGDPVLFFEYAITDSAITVLYAANLYGKNCLPAVTLTSATANVMLHSLAAEFGISTRKEGWRDVFNEVYRGIHSVDSKNSSCSCYGIEFLNSSNYEPISVNAEKILLASSSSYHGGYNQASKIGYFTNITYDYDLKNAYPTAMVCIQDVDWDDPIAKTYCNCSLDDIAAEVFQNGTPDVFMLAYIKSFSFPEGISYPCIVVMVDGTPVYPRTYDCKSEDCSDVPRVCITGVELFLAWKLGAKVEIEEAYMLNILTKKYPDGHIGPSKVLSVPVKQFVEDRAAAKHPKGNICEQILKVMINSMYGKTAQGVLAKKSYSAALDDMVDIGASTITNPVCATFITAIVRCVLIAAHNQCHELGKHTYSTTTDGFISDIDEVTLKGLDLYGFAKLLYDARMYLTNGTDGSFWEIKHKQCDLLNFTTRGNVSLRCNDPNYANCPDGVCAHCGISTGEVKDSYEDRKALMIKVLTRTAKVDYKIKLWTTLKELVTKKRKNFGGKKGFNVECKDFLVITVNKHSSLDFDMKRKPIRESFYTEKPVIEGISYRICCFDTEPFSTVGEYKMYRKQAVQLAADKKNNPSKALRTKTDWEDNFWRVIDVKERAIALGISSSVKKNSTSKGSAETTAKNAKTNGLNLNFKAKSDPVRDKLILNCIYACFAGVVDIPLLNGPNANAVEFFEALKASGLSYSFSYTNLSNYKKVDRQKYYRVSDPDIIEERVAKLEPVLSQLHALQPPPKKKAHSVLED